MSFYIHHQRLEEHTEDLGEQIARIRDLISRLRFLQRVSPAEDATMLRDSIRRLERVEEAFVRTRKVLNEFSDDTQEFSRQIGQQIEDLQEMARRVFS